MEFRSFDFEVRSMSDEGKFDGYASVFGSIAQGYGTVMDKGCFLKSIKDNDGFFPLLWFHSPMVPVGSFVAEEDKKGLVTHGDVDLDIEPGQRTYSGMKKGYIDRLSIGFDRIAEVVKDDITHITEAKLWEVSLITRNFAADEQALITDVRATSVGLQRVTQALRDGATEDLRQAIEELGLLLAEPVEGRPFPNFHACRLRNPGDFKKGSFVTTSRKSGGKKYNIVSGRLKGEDTLTEQAYRYPKDVWSLGQAKKHCKDHDGIRFEPASQSDSICDTMKEVKALFTREKPVLATSIDGKPPLGNEPHSHSLLDDLLAFGTTLKK